MSEARFPTRNGSSGWYFKRLNMCLLVFNCHLLPSLPEEVIIRFSSGVTKEVKEEWPKAREGE
jgi:hypothetical protein